MELYRSCPLKAISLRRHWCIEININYTYIRMKFMVFLHTCMYCLFRLYNTYSKLYLETQKKINRSNGSAKTISHLHIVTQAIHSTNNKFWIERLPPKFPKYILLVILHVCSFQFLHLCSKIRYQPFCIG